MPDSLVSLGMQVMYLFSHMTVLHVLDLVLVTLVFFTLFQALYQSRALQMLRGVIILSILGAALLVALPLTTFSWLVRILLLAGVIVLPLLFQDDLRRILVSVGRLGSPRGTASEYQHLNTVLAASIGQFAEAREGALIVLEGQTPLDDIAATGIALRAETVTSQLLGTIFYPKTPLHDGAVVLRGDRLVAASCILPVQQESTGDTHLGTRHRAALGLSRQAPDALVIVVSEETGRVSVAYGGQLYSGLSPDEFLGWLNRFAEQFRSPTRSRWAWLRGRGWLPTLTNLLVAMLLAVISWVSVVLQTNPPVQVTLDGVPVVVTGPDEGLVLMDEIPETVRVRVQSMRDRADLLDPATSRAELALEGLSAGAHNVPFNVTTADPHAQVLLVRPSALSVQLEPQVTAMLTPTVQIPDLNQLPPGYTVGPVSLSPPVVSVTGPQSEVQKIKEAQVSVYLGGRRTDFQESLDVQFVDANGWLVMDLQPLPASVLATVPMQRSFFTREIPVQPTIDRSGLEPNYEISGIQARPALVTLVGPRSALDGLGEFLVTAPVSLTGVYSATSVSVPLVLPPDVTALGPEGDSLKSVIVDVDVSPVNGYLVLGRSVEITGQPLTGTLTTRPGRVSVLLVGPKPLLDLITRNPELVIVTADLTGLPPGVQTVALEVQAPPGVQVQLFPAEVEVVVE